MHKITLLTNEINVSYFEITVGKQYSFNISKRLMYLKWYFDLMTKEFVRCINRQKFRNPVTKPSQDTICSS